MLFDRRRFLAGGAALLPAAAADAQPATRTRYYFVEQYLMEQGTQPARLAEFFSKGLLPALNKIHKGPKIFLDAVFAPHMPQTVAIYGAGSVEEIWQALGALNADKAFTSAYEEWEKGEAPYVSCNASLLRATSYSPEIEMPEKPGAPRYFELRSYHSPTERQARMLHERFAGAEIKIFHRSGIHPLFYSETVFGLNKPSLTYLMPFDSLDAREKAWAKFAADPEWVKVRKESIDRGGQITAVQNMSLYKATAYSPVR